MSRLPDRVSILRFRHVLERHQLAEQFLHTVNAQLSAKGYLLKEGSCTPNASLEKPAPRPEAPFCARAAPRDVLGRMKLQDRARHPCFGACNHSS